MSSRNERDVIDYVDDESHNEDETPFIPVRSDHGPDRVMMFFCGTFGGAIGGGIMPLGPWVGAALVAVGYGATALSLRGFHSLWVRSLWAGFTVAALCGVAILAAASIVPADTREAVEAAAERRMIFCGVFLMPWALAGAFLVAGLLLRLRRKPARTARPRFRRRVHPLRK